MDSEVVAAWAIILRDRLADRRVPEHVLNRVAVLLHRQPLEFVDAHITQEIGVVDGKLTVFTQDLLALVTLAGIKRSRPMLDEAPAGAVEVVVVPRRTLRKLTIPPAGEDWANYNGGWEMGPEELSWPAYGQVRLTYEGLSEDVVLGGPHGDVRELNPLAELIPRLVEDLASGQAARTGGGGRPV
jgi:hypothetical protein